MFGQMRRLSEHVQSWNRNGQTAMVLLSFPLFRCSQMSLSGPITRPRDNQLVTGSVKYVPGSTSGMVNVLLHLGKEMECCAHKNVMRKHQIMYISTPRETWTIYLSTVSRGNRACVAPHLGNSNEHVGAQQSTEDCQKERYGRRNTHITNSVAPRQHKVISTRRQVGMARVLLYARLEIILGITRGQRTSV